MGPSQRNHYADDTKEGGAVVVVRVFGEHWDPSRRQQYVRGLPDLKWRELGQRNGCPLREGAKHLP